MSIRGKAVIVGAYEHPRREIPDRTVAQIHREVAVGALADAGLDARRRRRLLLRLHRARLRAGVDGGVPRPGGPLRRQHRDRRQLLPRPRRPRRRRHRGRQVPGGAHHAGRAPAHRWAPPGRRRSGWRTAPRPASSRPASSRPVGNYALSASRHMHEFGTTSEQLAWIKVAASEHAQHNPNALLPNVVTVDDVLGVADGRRPAPPARLLRGHRRRRRAGGRAPRRRPRARPGRRVGARPRRGAQARRRRPHRPHLLGGPLVAARPPSRRRASTPTDIQYASIYDSFTITRAHRARGPRVLREGRGRRVRRRRRAAQPGRAAARSTPTAAGCATTTPPTAAA